MAGGEGVEIYLLPPMLVNGGFTLPPPPFLMRDSRGKEHERTGQVKATPEF